MNEVPLGTFLRQVKDEITLRDDVTYQTVGVLSYGKGLFERPSITGAQTSYKSYFRIRTNQVVYSKLFAWEGAVAVVPPTLNGRFVSQEFPTFDIDTQSALPQYVSLLCRWQPLWARLRQGETGMGGRRKRVHPFHLESVRVPLPSILDQRRIVDLIGAVDDTTSRVSDEGVAARQAYLSLMADLFAGPHEAPQWTNATLGQVATWFSGGTPKAGDPRYYGGEVPWAVIADLNDGMLAETAKSLTVDGLNVIGGRLAPVGAVLVSMYGTIGRVSMARVPMATNQAIAWAVPDERRLLGGFLFHYLRFIAPGLDSRGRGATQRNINREIIKTWPITIPTLLEQRHIVDLLNAASAVADATSTVQRHLTVVRAALLSAVLTGQHEIPASYDPLLKAS